MPLSARPWATLLAPPGSASRGAQRVPQSYAARLGSMARSRPWTSRPASRRRQIPTDALSRTMSFAHVDATLVHYFYISLAAGVLIILLAWGTTLAPAARVIGIALMAVGMYGAIKGAPYWSLRYEQQRAARTYEREAEAYFDRACLERAVIQLPPPRHAPTVWCGLMSTRQARVTSRATTILATSSDQDAVATR